MRWEITPSTVGGSARVAGDKSIAHRALMLGALANGTTTLWNLPRGQDVLSTAACMRGLGAEIDLSGTEAQVRSSGRLRAPLRDLDAGNSGTTMRLLSGILAGQPFSSRLTGDASLQRRPMRRVIEPLEQMGAHIESDDGKAPLAIVGRPLHGIRYTLPVASAQVKSAVLLAGLFAAGTTAVEEVVPARDHTERMLGALGFTIRRQDRLVEVEGGPAAEAFEMTVPGDFSSAAFLFAASLLTGGEICVDGVGINPTRTALLGVLRSMGARVSVHEDAVEMGEPVGRVTVSGSIDAPVDIGADDVPGLVDELPLLALLSTQAAGRSTVRGASELRMKESDRIRTVVGELRTLGADIEELPDGWVVEGPTLLQGGRVSSRGDHRLAMMLAVAGGIAEGRTVVEDAQAAEVSFPGFAAVFRSLAGAIDER